MRDDTPTVLTPILLLQGYRAGVFPMSEARDDPTIFWVDPRRRGILPLDGFHISRRLKRTLKGGKFRATLDLDFEGVLAGCAAREETWINETIYNLYLQLHEMGMCHSVEVWQDDRLVGGVYGVTLGGVFFGESMFSIQNDASKVALLYTVDRLKTQGFSLFDTQFITPHLRSLGAVEISRADYHEKLEAALEHPKSMGPIGALMPMDQLLQRSTQTS